MKIINRLKILFSFLSIFFLFQTFPLLFPYGGGDQAFAQNESEKDDAALDVDKNKEIELIEERQEETKDAIKKKEEEIEEVKKEVETIKEEKRAIEQDATIKEKAVIVVQEELKVLTEEAAATNDPKSIKKAQELSLN